LATETGEVWDNRSRSVSLLSLEFGMMCMRGVLLEPFSAYHAKRHAGQHGMVTVHSKKKQQND